MSRTLIVMRHAKAEPSAPTDFERELTDRGHRDATAAGRWLGAQGILPTHVLVSGATRTRQTWEDVALGAEWPLSLAVYDDGLYAASTMTVVDLVEGLQGTVLVIGHNPTMAGLVQHLDDGGSDFLVLDYPTSAVTVLEADTLDSASARITGFFTPAR
jgi:phosphohistidine phosphatase